MLPQPEAVVGVNGHVAQLHHREGFFRVLRADVDIEMLHGGGFALLQRLTDQHALHAVFKADMAGLTDVQADAAHGSHPQEALFFHSGHDKADMIHMRGEHNPLSVGIGAVFHADQIAQIVPADAVHMLPNQPFDHVGHLGFPARRAVGVGQCFQQFKHLFLPRSSGFQRVR